MRLASASMMSSSDRMRASSAATFLSMCVCEHDGRERACDHERERDTQKRCASRRIVNQKQTPITTCVQWALSGDPP
jgi:hypothetical protein